MARTNQPNLVLRVACDEDSTRTWALDPEGRDSFRIVVQCRREELAPSHKAHSWPRYFGAIAHATLWVVAFLRTGHP